MKTSHVLPIAIATALSASGCYVDDPPDRSVAALFTSDEHSHALAFAPESDDYPVSREPGKGTILGGVARRSTVIARERAAAGRTGLDSILVSAGDNHMGALPAVAFETASLDYGIMRALGYDATTLGNHELDYGPAALARSISAAQAGMGLPPIVASNIHFSDESPRDDTLAAHYGAEAAIQPYRVLETASGLRIGVIGYLGVNAASVEPNKAPVEFSAKGAPEGSEGDASVVLPKLYEDLQPIVDALHRKEHVDLVVALGHAGMADPSRPVEEGEDYQIAKNVLGIDVIISGHSHLASPEPIVVENARGSTVVLEASALGAHVGRIDFTVHANGAVTWDKDTQGLLPVDDTIVPSDDGVALVDQVIQTVEEARDVGGAPVLARLLGEALGEEVKDDPATTGDLYFHPVVETTFDVADVDHLLDLSADAMLAAADAWGAPSGTRTVMALESAGLLGAFALPKGRTGVISAADAFGVVPFGTSPVDGTIGYPLVRAYVWLVELRAIFEATLALGPTSADFHFSQAGVRVEYDASRPSALTSDQLLDPSYGKVVRILVDSDHSDGFEQLDQVIYDREAGIGGPFDIFPVVTSSYIAEFATSVGASLKDEHAKPVTIEGSILKRPDGREIKQIAAFLGYLHDSPGGVLPARYDATWSKATKRYVCVAGCE